MMHSKIQIGQRVRHTTVDWVGLVVDDTNPSGWGGDCRVKWDNGCETSAFSKNLELIDSIKEQNVQKGNFIIGSVNNDGEVSFSKKPKQHTNKQLARAEAERLAKSTPTKKFIVVQIIGTAKASNVIWE